MPVWTISPVRGASLVLAAWCLSAAGPALAQPAVREGAGERRTALDRMELKPFPAELWGKLEGWTNGEALSPARTSGNVVLIYTWSSWYPVSMQPLPLVQSLHARYADKGLIVVGVHHKDEWAGAAEAAARRGATFLLAHDAGNALREALRVDQDPDFYLIDRAGRLRLADVATGSVEPAVRALVEETVEQAADLPAILERRRQEQEELAARTGDIRTGIDLRELPEVPFEAPKEEDYAAAAWPRLTDREREMLGLDRNSSGPPQIPRVTVPEEGWFPRKPPTAGRAMVIYPWATDIRASYDPMMDRMDRLQKERGRDLVVLGVMVQSLDPNRRNEQTQETPEEFVKRFTDFLKIRRMEHFQTADPTGATLSVINQGREVPVPLVLVVSSDGTLRWAGHPDAPAFRAAIDQILRNDPGVRARRQAEAEYIKGQR